ncbi:MAG: PLDc N-terminal domain-containing protein [Planctomycetes bacterium]|nr:PLDc N-terminal domain-containing protein [Planctomycetota bacterium]
MFTWCRFPFWPIRPIFGIQVLWGVLAIVGVIFSLIMLIDCLKRPTSKFYNPLTKEGEYDKLIWAVAIVLSFSFYFVGAIVYFVVIKRAKPEKKE